MKLAVAHSCQATLASDHTEIIILGVVIFVLGLSLIIEVMSR